MISSIYFNKQALSKPFLFSIYFFDLTSFGFKETGGLVVVRPAPWFWHNYFFFGLLFNFKFNLFVWPFS